MPSALLQVYSHPAVVFADYSNNELPTLKYMRSDDVVGNQWPVNSINVASVPAAATIALSAAMIDGRPAVAWHDSQSKRIFYLRSSDSVGSTWSANKVLEVNAVSVSDCVLLELPTSRLGVIATILDDDSVWLLHLLEADGRGTDLRAVGLAASRDGGVHAGVRIAAAIVEGRVAVAVVDGMHIRYKRASSDSSTVFANEAVTLADNVGTHFLTLLHTGGGVVRALWVDMSTQRVMMASYSELGGVVLTVLASPESDQLDNLVDSTTQVLSMAAVAMLDGRIFVSLSVFSGTYSALLAAKSNLQQNDLDTVVTLSAVDYAESTHGLYTSLLPTSLQRVVLATFLRNELRLFISEPDYALPIATTCAVAPDTTTVRAGAEASEPGVTQRTLDSETRPSSSPSDSNSILMFGLGGAVVLAALLLCSLCVLFARKRAARRPLPPQRMTIASRGAHAPASRALSQRSATVSRVGSQRQLVATYNGEEGNARSFSRSSRAAARSRRQSHQAGVPTRAYMHPRLPPHAANSTPHYAPAPSRSDAPDHYHPPAPRLMDASGRYHLVPDRPYNDVNTLRPQQPGSAGADFGEPEEYGSLRLRGAQGVGAARDADLRTPTLFSPVDEEYGSLTLRRKQDSGLRAENELETYGSLTLRRVHQDSQANVGAAPNAAYVPLR